jgi:RNA polymerase sigma-70 factor (ECF subfamily)
MGILRDTVLLKTREHSLAHTAPPDREGFEREALVHLDAVYRTALRLSGNPVDAEDLVQETMLKAVRAWHRFEPGTNAKAWLLTILRHTYINQLRAAKHRTATVDVHDVEPFTVFRDIQDADPEGTLFAAIVDDEVLRAIDALPPEFREVLVLSDAEGLSYAEIAGVIGAPVGTVKSRLFRARQLLQKRLYDFAVHAGYVRQRERA